MIHAPTKSVARLRIAVLAGGESAERAVSLASGLNVAQSLERAGHTVVTIDPMVDEAADCAAAKRSSDRILAARLCDVDWSTFDVCFLALHGGAGENGRVQRFFEHRGIRFTGPGSASAQVAMSKTASKAALRAAGVPTPPDATFDADTPLDLLCQQSEGLGFPVVVKPDGQGSSLGVGLARTRGQLAACRDAVLRLDRKGLVEPFIAGREFTVAIVGRELLPVVEVLAGGPLFSYADKYTPGTPHCRVADDLPADQAETIRSAALAAARALDTRGLVRVDLRLDVVGRPWVLELNAIPGLTPTSLVPLAARHAGWEMPQFCERLVKGCLNDAGPAAGQYRLRPTYVRGNAQARREAGGVR